jgi:nicotinamide mononucleotide (NMN) deamidase PncC
MVKGLLAVPPVALACAIPGIAGSSGGTPSRPSGTVFIAVGERSGVTAARHPVEWRWFQDHAGHPENERTDPPS